MAIIHACCETIPISESGCSNVKAVPGWNEYIEGYFRTSLFWHSLWIDNGKMAGVIISNPFRKSLIISASKCILL